MSLILQEDGFAILKEDSSNILTEELTAYTLLAETGSFTLTGNDASLRADRKLIAETGSFVLTGNDSSLRADRKLIAETGSFALTGYDAILKKFSRIIAETGVFTLTGIDAQIYRSKDGWILRQDISSEYTERTSPSTPWSERSGVTSNWDIRDDVGGLLLQEGGYKILQEDADAIIVGNIIYTKRTSPITNWTERTIP